MLSYIQYGHTFNFIAEEDEKYTIVGNFNPLIVISSLLMFMGFSFLNIKTQKMEKLSKDTFIIYLFHAGVWDIATKIIFNLVFGAKTDPRYTIPLGIIIVFGISWILCSIYNRFWAVINQNNRVSNKLCKMIFL